MVGTLMGEYTQPRHQESGKTATKEEYRNAAACIKNNHRIEITSLTVTDAYFSVPESLTRFGDRIARLLEDSAKETAAKEQRSSAQAAKSADQTESDDAEKAAEPEKKKSGKQAGTDADKRLSRRMMEIEVAYGAAMQEARQAESRGDGRAAMQAYQKAYRQKPTVEAKSRISELQGGLALSNLARGLATDLLAERKAAREKRAREHRDNRDQEKQEIADYLEQWEQHREEIAAHGRVVGYMLTGDARYKQKSLSTRVPSLSRIRQEEIRFSPSTVVRNQAALPKGQRASQLHVIAVYSVERGFISNLGRAAKNLRASGSLAAVKSNTPLPTMKLFVSNGMTFPTEALVEMGPDAVEDVLRTALNDEVYFPPDETILVASSDKGIIEAIRAQAIDTAAKNIAVSQPFIDGSAVDLKRLANEGISIDMALKDLSSGHTLKIGSNRYVYFWEDKYISVDGEDVISSSEHAHHMWRSWSQSPQRRILPMSFMLEGQLFTADFRRIFAKWLAPSAPRPWKLLSGTFVSRDYVVGPSDKLDDKPHDSCIWFSNAGYRVHSGTWKPHKSGTISLKPIKAGLIAPCHQASLQKRFFEEDVRFRLPYRKLRSSFMNPDAVFRLYRHLGTRSAYLTFRTGTCGGQRCLTAAPKRMSLYNKTRQWFGWKYYDLDRRADLRGSFHKDVKSEWKKWVMGLRKEVVGKKTLDRRTITGLGDKIAIGNPVLIGKRVKLDASTMDYHTQMLSLYRAMQDGKLHRKYLGHQTLSIAISD